MNGVFVNVTIEQRDEPVKFCIERFRCEIEDDLLALPASMRNESESPGRSRVPQALAGSFGIEVGCSEVDS